MKQIRMLVALLSLSVFAHAGTWETRQSENIKYQIFLPQQLPTLKQTSLMVTLHGCAQQSEDLSKYGNWDAAAENYSTIVVAPQVPNGGVIFGCWDYHGANHAEEAKHHAPIIQLVLQLLKDPALKIDPKRVYVSGLSSGSAEAVLLGCLRPDLFAGMGLNSGPAVPSDSGDISRPPIEAPAMEKFCRSLAGVRESAFKTQSLSVITSDQDFAVSPQHSKITVEAFRLIYELESSEPIDMQGLEGSNKNGDGRLFLRKNGRPQMSFIVNNGIGHNWAAGSGVRAPGAYITQNSINYPLYLLQFFESSNPRR